MATGKPRVGGFSQTWQWMRRFSGPVLAGLLVAVVSLPVAPDPGVPLRDKDTDQSDRTIVQFDRTHLEFPFYSSVRARYENQGHRPVRDTVIALSADSIIHSNPQTTWGPNVGS